MNSGRSSICAQHESGRFDNSAPKLIRALADKAPDSLPLLHRAASVSMAASEFREAEAYWRRLVEVAPEEPEYLIALSKCRWKLGDRETATNLLANGLTSYKSTHRLLQALVSMLERSSGLKAALKQVDYHLARYPGNTQALAEKVRLLFDLGRTSEALTLMDWSQLVKVVELEQLNGRCLPEDFNQALAKEIVNNPDLDKPELNAATRGGLQVALDPQASRVLGTLCSYIEAEMCSYRKEVSVLGHPMADSQASIKRMVTWAVLLEETGHQVPHLHPYGWSSAVYYVHCPGSSQDAGALCFGVHPGYRGGGSIREALHTYVPKEGQLVIFPSFFVHWTKPVREPVRRICVACDLETLQS